VLFPEGAVVQVQPDTHKPALVLLHGWGYDNNCWPEYLLEQLKSCYNLILLDLPGHGQDTYVADQRNTLEQLDQWIVSTKRVLPFQYTLMAWSLGAQIAIRMAHNDRRIKRLILMAVNPKFITGDGWPAAMVPEMLLQFMHGYQALATKTLRRFASLQAQGSVNPKVLVARIIQLMPVQTQKAFGLSLLQVLDERAHLCQLWQPCYLELAKNDELVPCKWVDELQLPNNVQVNYVEGGHGYLLEQQSISRKMAKFMYSGVAR